MTTESLRWFKSSYSSNGGSCVEITTDLITSHGVVPVRDSKDQRGPVLTVGATAFAGFVARVKGAGRGTV
ncbi:DUF397 domain-containing protein [Streptomyces sp. NPDC049954]|uniref:DUF397 domain-containing protein n=1 Tax=Streptomyces sp. NPDC049954 TaxID=3155779 RepID=UPI0034219CF2